MAKSLSGSTHFRLMKLPLWPTVAVLVIVYAVGVVGLYLEETQALFMALTPLNLAVSAILLFAFHRHWNKAFFTFFIVTYLVGFGIEMLGTNTGWPFGSYTYGASLGTKVVGTPLMIGVNWLILVYATGAISRKLPIIRLGRAVVGALLMVMLDIVLEPVAIQLDFWTWEATEVPIANYIAWFVIAFALHVLYQMLKFRKSNQLAPALYIVMLLFFTTLNFLL